MVTVCN